MKEIIGLLDSPGGHMFVCLLLIGIGIGAQALQIELSKDTLVIFALGVLSRSMLGQNGKGAGVEAPKS